MATQKYKVNGEWTELPTLRVGEVYSENEVVIGTWIDGKTLYRKVLTFSGGGFVSLNVSDIAIDKVVSIKGIAERTNGEQHILPDSYLGTGQRVDWIYYSPSSKTFDLNFREGWNDNKGGHLIVEYTKLTN